MSAIWRDQSRCSSVSQDSRQKVSDQIRLQSEKINTRRGRSPSARPSRRWSTIISPDVTSSRSREAELRPPSVPSSPCPLPGRVRTECRPPVYTTALIKHSQRLRDRSSSPSFSPPILPDKSEVYRSNSDYYRGKVKSVYEKDPLFKDFLRNLTITESSITENANLSSLKQRFNNLVQNKRGPVDKDDPFTPSRRTSEIYQPKSAQLSRKFISQPKPPPLISLPALRVYHRNN